MDRRTFLWTTAGCAAYAAVGTAAYPARQTRPNVIVVQPDQHRGTIMGCAGDTIVQTPHLDRLAAEGIFFPNCVSASPVCSPYRGTVQTGLYPHKHGVVNNGLPLDPNLKCFAEVFAEAGYATGYIGKWHLDGGKPKPEGGRGITKTSVGGYVVPERRQGWQEWNGYEKSHEFFEVWKFNADAKKERVDAYDWEPTWHTDMALDFIKRNRDAGKPSLFYLAYGPPHKPEQCTEEFSQMYDPDKFEIPPEIDGKIPADKEQALRVATQIYYGQITAIDHEIGRLVKGLKELGVDDNTIILYTSDHGDRLGKHWIKSSKSGGKKRNEGQLSVADMRGKGAPYQTAFRIPFIVRWPKGIKSGQTCDVLASSADLTPTILDLASLPPIEGMQGDSMAGWCTEGDGPRNEAVWIGLANWRAAWDGRYVYARGQNFNHLFDHEKDPHELNNLLDSPNHKKLRNRMHKLLIKLAERAEDPMLPDLQNMDA